MTNALGAAMVAFCSRNTSASPTSKDACSGFSPGKGRMGDLSQNLRLKGWQKGTVTATSYHTVIIAAPPVTYKMLYVALKSTSGKGTALRAMLAPKSDNPKRGEEKAP